MRHVAERLKGKDGTFVVGDPRSRITIIKCNNGKVLLKKNNWFLLQLAWFSCRWRKPTCYFRIISVHLSTFLLSEPCQNWFSSRRKKMAQEFSSRFPEMSFNAGPRKKELLLETKLCSNNQQQFAQSFHGISSPTNLHIQPFPILYWPCVYVRTTYYLCDTQKTATFTLYSAHSIRSSSETT